MSFATPRSSSRSSKPLVQHASAKSASRLPRPFRRLPYAEAMAKYGSDKPDLRFGLEIQDLSHVCEEVAVRHLPRDRRARRHVRGFVIPGAASTRARELDELVEQAKQLGAAGILWARAARTER